MLKTSMIAKGFPEDQRSADGRLEHDEFSGGSYRTQAPPVLCFTLLTEVNMQSHQQLEISRGGSGST